jgi:BirA family biotin operon repressor/biotin-[acetyl-CoA-carboxylase] ligase
MQRIDVYDELVSTSTKLLRGLAKGEVFQEGYWLIANRQTGGRGRHGKSWHDGVGNFMGSTFVAKVKGNPPLSTLALVSALAVYETVIARIGSDCEAQLKWPNDLLVGGAKIAGILLEGAEGGVVVGIGVNLAVAPKVLDRLTTSIRKLGGDCDRDAFAQDLANAFDREVAQWRADGLETVLKRWQALAHPIGTPMKIGDGQADLVEGTFAGLASDGALQLRLADGSTRAIHAGEVNLA